jgi:type IV secretion system protein VirB1
MEMLACPNLAVSPEVMQHVVQVESGANPYAIGVVGGRLARQPRNMDEALATAQMLESKGYNFSVGIAQVNRTNLGRYGLDTYRKAFNTCNNLVVGAQILARCYNSAQGDWGKAFSCYYSGNFSTGFRNGYVRKVYASINRQAGMPGTPATLADLAIPPRTSAGTDVSTRGHSRDKALRSVVVYPGDSGRYRVALRSTPVNGTTTAMAPLVISAKKPSPHLEDAALAEAMANKAPERAVAQAAPSSPPRSSRNQTASSRMPAPTTGGEFHTFGNGVFKPQVRGPDDPATTFSQEPTRPRADGADLRLEPHDAAFVV